jgi:hypothetical protein
MELLNRYSDPNVGAALGLNAEFLTLDGFARHRFLMLGRNTRELDGRVWTRSNHDLDFIFERDGVRYGVEVKNRLQYIEHEELETKIRLSQYLGLRPVFAVRMLPRTWVWEVGQAGGFSLVMKYQLYPWTHRELAREVRETLGLPVDAPRALQDGTMQRFLKWHSANSARNSPAPPQTPRSGGPAGAPP